MSEWLWVNNVKFCQGTVSWNPKWIISPGDSFITRCTLLKLSAERGTSLSVDPFAKVVPFKSFKNEIEKNWNEIRRNLIRFTIWTADWWNNSSLPSSHSADTMAWFQHIFVYFGEFGQTLIAMWLSAMFAKTAKQRQTAKINWALKSSSKPRYAQQTPR